MNDTQSSVDRPVPTTEATRYGSDAIADMLRALGVEYIALTPGASFRGLHDSLVNHLGNARPEMLLALHEEHAVAIAHGYARVTGRPMAVALHSNVGLMHATMAIFNAWCDRIPILLLGGVGPMDAIQRRPWIDWIHTARDLGALVRDYTKWDDQPGSVAAALEALMRAHRIATTPPAGPVYVCLDAAIQEQAIDAQSPSPDVRRFARPTPADPPADAIAKAAKILSQAQRPLIMVGRVSSDVEDWRRRVELAERLNARVLTDLKTGASFPTQHPLHPHGPAIFASEEACALIRDADAILSLDWIDLGGTFRLACGDEWPRAHIVQCSVDQYSHNGWSMDYQALPPADLAVLAGPDAFVGALLDALPARAASASSISGPAPTDSARGGDAGAAFSIVELAHATLDALSVHVPSYIRLPIGWPGECCRFAHPLDYIGFDGGGGVGSGPGMAVGAALALRGTARLPVAIVGDGDCLMGLTAIWSAVHYRVPLLVIVANNHSFFNDELHQERTARARGRPIENRSIGVRVSDPSPDFAQLARGQGAMGFGPVASSADYRAALAQAIASVETGAVCVIDAHVVPEYARAVSSAVLRQIPDHR